MYSVESTACGNRHATGPFVRSPPALLDLYIWLKKKRAAQGRVESLKRSLGPTCILYSTSTFVLVDEQFLVHSTGYQPHCSCSAVSYAYARQAFRTY